MQVTAEVLGCRYTNLGVKKQIETDELWRLAQVDALRFYRYKDPHILSGDCLVIVWDRIGTPEYHLADNNALDIFNEAVKTFTPKLLWELGMTILANHSHGYAVGFEEGQRWLRKQKPRPRGVVRARDVR